jgi:hypothetical protein
MAGLPEICEVLAVEGAASGSAKMPQRRSTHDSEQFALSRDKMDSGLAESFGPSGGRADGAGFDMIRCLFMLVVGYTCMRFHEGIDCGAQWRNAMVQGTRIRSRRGDRRASMWHSTTRPDLKRAIRIRWFDVVGNAAADQGLPKGDASVPR